MHKLLKRFALSALVMLGFPCVTVVLAPEDLGMVICLMLFFVINPCYVLVSGWKDGKNIRLLWSSPAITAFLFLAGTWTFLEWGEKAFLVYALGYFLIGMTALGISALVKK